MTMAESAITSSLVIVTVAPPISIGVFVINCGKVR